MTLGDERAFQAGMVNECNKPLWWEFGDYKPNL
jgi:hypothetical protein